LFIGVSTSLSSSPESAWSPEIAPHEFLVFCRREIRIGLLAGPIVARIGVFPKLLDDCALDPNRLERRQHGLDEREKPGVVEDRPVVLPFKQRIDLGLAQLQQKVPVYGSHFSYPECVVTSP
jgi:hypothetical protein